MSIGSIYKPRYKFVNRVRSKIWINKNGYLRRFYERRSRRVKRGGLFRRYVLVANNRKWTIARQNIRPFKRQAGFSKKASSSTINGRPVKHRYISSFYQKQQLRFFYGKRKEHVFSSLFKNYRTRQGNTSQSFFSLLESRVDRTLYRRRIFPTIYACRQFVHYHGICINNQLETSPRAYVKVGDTVSIPEFVWKQYYRDLFCRVYYRRWGLYLFSRRFFTRLKKKLFKSRALLARVSNKKFDTNKAFRFHSPFAFSNILQAFSKDADKNVFVSSRNKLPRRAITLFSPKQKIDSSFFDNSLFNNKVITENEDFFAFNEKADTQSPTDFSQSRHEQVKSQELFSSFFRSKKQSSKGIVLKKNYISAFPFSYNNSAFSVPFPQERNYQAASYDVHRPSQIKTFYSQLSLLAQQRNADKVGGKKKQFWSRFSNKIKKRTLFYYSQKRRKSFIPWYNTKRKQSWKKTSSFQGQTIKTSSSKYKNRSRVSRISRYRTFRQQLSKFIRRWRYFSIRNSQYTRLNPVHFYFPVHLQPDFRTLRILKISTPFVSQIYTGFRHSPAKIYSFYKARGF